MIKKNLVTRLCVIRLSSVPWHLLTQFILWKLWLSYDTCKRFFQRVSYTINVLKKNSISSYKFIRLSRPILRTVIFLCLLDLNSSLALRPLESSKSEIEDASRTCVLVCNCLVNLLLYNISIATMYTKRGHSNLS